MGRRNRTSARTGDKKIYAGRGSEKKVENDDGLSGDEAEEMFHNQRELEQDTILFDRRKADGDSEDEHYGGKVEGVFDLGGSDSDDDDVSSDDDSSSNEEESASSLEQGATDSDDSEDDQSDDSDDDINNLREELNKPTVADELLNWGKKKRDYYHGDTADLEIGQEEDDAFLEEEAAQEVLKSRYAQMEEGDFEMDVDEDEEEEVKVPKRNAVATFADILSGVPGGTNIDRMTLPTHERMPIESLKGEERRRAIESDHPEFFPLIEHFKESVDGLAHTVLPVTKQILENEENAKAVGATIEGSKYLQHKKLLLLSSALNLTTYLLLKNEGTSNVRMHPIMSKLNYCDEQSKKLRDRVEEPLQLEGQLKAIVKATALMDGGELSDDEFDDDEHINRDQTFDEGNTSEGDVSESRGDVDDESIASSRDDSSSEDEKVLENEARFAIRPEDVSITHGPKKRKSSKIGTSNIEFGDDDLDGDGAARARKGLLATMNSLAQREQTRAKRASRVGSEHTDEVKKRENGNLEDAFAMMDEMIGPMSEEEEGAIDNELDSEDDNDFYSAIKKNKRVKKEAKQSMYTVAPKYPRLEEFADGERAISKKIQKNRGLVAHKPKINRNPRVKKREQYRKALIRRKGTVRDVRTGETDAYGGEATGIKSSISRSRKIKS